MESETPRDRRGVWRGLPVSWKVLVPAVAALGLGIGGAVAAASIPASNGTITGCYVTPTSDSDSPVGSLRVIDPSDTTESDPAVSTAAPIGEATITWNQQGQPGPQGPPGQNGMKDRNGQNGAERRGGAGRRGLGGTRLQHRRDHGAHSVEPEPRRTQHRSRRGESGLGLAEPGIRRDVLRPRASPTR